MRYSLSLLLLVTSLVHGAVPLQNQSLTVASGLPCRDGLSLWLSPWTGYWSDAGVTPAVITNTIYQWNDWSGNGKHCLQPTANLRPSLCTDWSVLFPFLGLKYWTNGVSVNTRSYTIIQLANQFSSVDGNGCVFGASGVSSDHSPSLFVTYALDPRHALAFNGGTGNNTNYPPVDPVPCALYGGASASKDYCETLASVASFGAATAGTSTAAEVGRYYNYGLQLNGSIKHLLIWNRVLATNEINAVFNWLYDLVPSHRTFLRRVLCTGDSLTAGYLTTDVQTYPYQLQQLEGVRSRVWNVGIHAQVISGQATVDALANAALTNYLVTWCGVNDLSGGATAGACWTNILNFCSNRTTAGWKPVVLTVTPNSGFNAAKESNRVALNNLILGGASNFFGVVDVAADSRLTNAADTTYYADGLHMTKTGYGVVAALVNAFLSLH